MNQPTREEFDHLQADYYRLKKEVDKLKEHQHTEPMKITRIEIEQKDINITLDNHTEMLRELDQKSDLHTQVFQRVEAILGEHSRQLEQLTHMAIGMEKRFDAIAEVQRLILERLPEKGK